ncbi:methyltransferase type 11 [Deltaproteobacteria bacterium Smac51]|nr:methyltransferase type 11 [Deltaproteobacteria bacterium Smac51]
MVKCAKWKNFWKTNKRSAVMSIYEREQLRTVFGGALRPGGVAVTQAALDICAFAVPSHLLDVGCGTGETLRFLMEKGFEACGLDISSKLLEEASQYGPVVRGDFHDLPWTDSHFDGVFCECSLCLARDRKAVISECGRVLKANGRLVISDIFVKGGAENLKPDHSSGPVTLSCLSTLLKGCGFQIVAEVDFEKALKELAARLIWHFGSGDILKTLWSSDGCNACETGSLTYSLVIAEKTGF